MKRIFRRQFSMVEVIMLSAIAVVAIGIYAYAATTVPYTFQKDTIAKSSEVNANFDALVSAIDALGSGSSCTGTSANDEVVKVGPLCVDKYEASVWSSPDGTGTQYGATADDYTAAGFPDNGNWTTPLYAVSMANVKPSANITWFQAQQACALSGKRLLTNAEWQMAAAGTPDPGTDDGATDCNISAAGAVLNTGARSSCASKWMANDMVGNVSEWVADWIQGPDGDSGNVGTQWAPNATFNSTATYGDDLIFGINDAPTPVSDHFPAALIRGGGPNDGPDAGVFALLAALGPSYSDGEVGFRCAR
jgi:formylglycine-generating enzyme required for sulfatase activity